MRGKQPPTTVRASRLGRASLEQLFEVSVLVYEALLGLQRAVWKMRELGKPLSAAFVSCPRTPKPCGHLIIWTAVVQASDILP